MRDLIFNDFWNKHHREYGSKYQAQLAFNAGLEYGKSIETISCGSCGKKVELDSITKHSGDDYCQCCADMYQELVVV